jgi:hypothetical protein
VNNKIVTSRQVEIVPPKQKVICSDRNEGEQIEKVICIDSTKEEEEEVPETSCSNSKEDGVPLSPDEKQVRRSSRLKTHPKYLDNYVLFVNVADATTPQTYQEALRSPEIENWKQAMDNEYQSVIEHKTWELVPYPTGKKVIRTKWVYTRKADGRFKARLVALDCQHPKAEDENSYSPVISLITLKTILAVSAKLKYFVYQFDVTTAYLNGVVKSEICHPTRRLF